MFWTCDSKLRFFFFWSIFSGLSLPKSYNFYTQHIFTYVYIDMRYFTPRTCNYSSFDKIYAVHRLTFSIGLK